MMANGLGEVMGASMTMLFNPVVWIALLVYPRLSAGLTFALSVVVQLLCVLFVLVFAALADGEFFGPAYAYLPPAVQALLAAVVSGVVIAGIFLGLRRLFLKDGGNSRQAEEP